MLFKKERRKDFLFFFSAIFSHAFLIKKCLFSPYEIRGAQRGFKEERGERSVKCDDPGSDKIFTGLGTFQLILLFSLCPTLPLLR